MWVSEREFNDEETLELINKLNEERKMQEQDHEKFVKENLKKRAKVKKARITKNL